ncbi:hypothetical protein HispidOSU_028528 [Sigmodon hispidus]
METTLVKGLRGEAEDTKAEGDYPVLTARVSGCCPLYLTRGGATGAYCTSDPSDLPVAAQEPQQTLRSDNRRSPKHSLPSRQSSSTSNVKQYSEQTVAQSVFLQVTGWKESSDPEPTACSQSNAHALSCLRRKHFPTGMFYSLVAPYSKVSPQYPVQQHLPSLTYNASSPSHQKGHFPLLPGKQRLRVLLNNHRLPLHRVNKPLDETANRQRLHVCSVFSSLHHH